MEKVMVLLRDSPQGAERDDAWCADLRGPVANQIVALGVCGLTVNVRDDAVRASLMTLTTLDPQVVAVISMWTQQCSGPAVGEAIGLLAQQCASVAAYLVTESVPLSPPPTEFGTRTIGFANVALLRRPDRLDPETWLTRWQHDHTPVALATQATFGYTQNAVVRALTPGAPAIDAIVEELFPSAAMSDLRAFFGASDDADLHDRMRRMIASTSAFGANENVDTVPTSRYVISSPFI